MTGSTFKRTKVRPGCRPGRRANPRGGAYRMLLCRVPVTVKSAVEAFADRFGTTQARLVTTVLASWCQGQVALMDQDLPRNGDSTSGGARIRV